MLCEYGGHGWFLWADTKTASRKYEQALKLYSPISNTEMSQAECHHNIGAALCDLGRYEEAIASQKKALNITAMNTICWSGRRVTTISALLYAILGRYEQSIASHEQALNLYREERIDNTERDQEQCFGLYGESLYGMGPTGQGFGYAQTAGFYGLVVLFGNG